MVAVQTTGATKAAVRIVDTVNRVGEGFEIIETVPRDNLWAIQTPQIFNYGLIVKAHDAVKDNVTDDGAMVERIGGRVTVYEGTYSNIKITTKEDIFRAEQFLRATHN